VIAMTLAALGAMTVAIERCERLDERQPIHQRSISVIIPARNEEMSLPRLLDDLAAQRNVRLEIIVVDDASTDGTADAASRDGVQLVRAGCRPPGWNPKVWAIVVGVGRSTGEVLVFLDADVRLSPTAVGSVAARLDDGPGLVSVAPHHRAHRPIESLSAPWNIVTVAAGQRLAVGSLVAISRHDYDRIGGHAACPSTIVDDIELARSVRRHGIATALFTGGDLVTVRSYPGGWREIVDGWTKNTSAGLSRTSPVAGLVVTAWVMSLLAPLVLACRGARRRAVFVWMVTGWHLRRTGEMVGDFDRRVVGIGSPLLGVFFAGITARSIWIRAMRRPARWKGRQLTPAGIEAA
jgi:4,4'-diaponeurosporenoate glycosyltransferase